MRRVVAVAIVVSGATSFASAQTATAPDADVKAAFLFNFAKFTEWPALASDAPITACSVGDEGVAAALAETVRGRNISGHALEVSRPQDSTTWRTCHLLFLADGVVRRAAAQLVAAPLRATWHIHGVGLDGGETGTDRLEEGSVIAFEPMFSVDGDAYYMEDMILVTESGHEILTRGLPYTADEIEAVMRL